MVDAVVEELGGTADTAYEETIRVPRNVMGLLRQSYDSREKVLDWMLAIAVALLLAYVFKPQLMGMFGGDPGPNAGTQPHLKPNQDVGQAFPNSQPINAPLYTYNMPASRQLRDARGPAGTRTPDNPSDQPHFPS